MITLNYPAMVSLYERILSDHHLERFFAVASKALLKIFCEERKTIPPPHIVTCKPLPTAEMIRRVQSSIRMTKQGGDYGSGVLVRITINNIDTSDSSNAHLHHQDPPIFLLEGTLLINKESVCERVQPSDALGYRPVYYFTL